MTLMNITMWQSCLSGCLRANHIGSDPIKPMRSVLLKLGIGSSVIHVVLGLGSCFVGPIIANWIMTKTKRLEFFLYPNKFVKKRN